MDVTLIWAKSRIPTQCGGDFTHHIRPVTTLTHPCDKPPNGFKEQIEILAWGISLTMLWQKAHSRSTSIVRRFRTDSRDVINLLLFSDLYLCCNSQQFDCDTVPVVQTHPAEA